MGTTSMSPTEETMTGPDQEVVEQQAEQDQEPERPAKPEKPDKKKKPEKPPAKGEFDGLVIGRMVRFVMNDHAGVVGERLGIVTRVVNKKKGVVDMVVYPHRGDFHKNAHPGLQMGATDVPYHPGEDPPGSVLLVAGTWKWPTDQQ